MTLNFLSHLLEHIYLLNASITGNHSLHYAINPAKTLTAWCALATTLMHVEVGKSGKSLNDVC